MDTRDQDRLAYYRKNISEGRVDAKMGTRLLAYAADILLAWLIALIAFTAGIQILINGGLSKELGTLAKSMQDEAIASSLIHYTAEGAAETDLVRSERYVKAIYGYDGSEQPKDELFQYYCVYVSKGKEATPVSDFNKNILKIDDADSFFELHGEYAVLKPANVALLDNYYSIDKTAEGINLHKAIVNFYSAAHDAAWKQFREAEPYVGMLNEYMAKATAYYVAIGGVHIGCYFLSSAICFLLIPAIKKRGTTFGKKILHIEPVMLDGKPITLASIFIRGAIEMLLSCFLIPLCGLFIYGFDSMTVPFLVAGPVVAQLSIFFIAGLILSIVSLVFAIARKDNRALTDLAGGTWVITADPVSIRNAQAELKAKMKEEAERGSDGE